MTTVALLGPELTFSHEAGSKLYPDADIKFQPSFARVFDLVYRGMVDYGVLPVENSSTGSVNDAYLPLLDQDYEPLTATVKVRIVDELILPITHNLLAARALPLESIEVLFTHPQPQLQCAHYIQNYLPNARIEIAESTSDAALRTANTDNSACIAGDMVSTARGLVVLQAGIQDLYTNLTRFVAISSIHSSRQTGGLRKSTIAAVLPDQPGALVGALQLLAAQNINVLNIKTLPVRDTRVLSGFFKDWFVLDIETGEDTPEFIAFVKERERNSRLFVAYKFLGSYPAFDMLGGGTTEPVISSHLISSGPAADGIEQLIDGGETGSVEFKSTMRIDMRTGTKNRDLELAIAKTIAAFLNTEGGVLVIGVGDDRKTVGIEADIASVSRKDDDGYLSALFQIVVNSLGEEFCQFVKPAISLRHGHKICIVHVSRGTRAAWLSESGHETFYIRTGNSSRPLSGRKVGDYIARHFPQERHPA